MPTRKHLALLLTLYIAIVLYTLLAIAFSWPRPAWLLAVSTLTGFAFAFLHQTWRSTWLRALLLFAITAGVGLGLESLGVATGLVYGPYHYTDQLGYKAFGLVPLIIPLAWFMVGAPSMSLAERLMPAGRPGWLRSLLLAATAGLIMTSWDLAMDPMMVAAGHWIWETPGAYFGIPIHNFIGWWFTTFSAVLLYQLLLPSRKREEQGKPIGLALIFYAAAGLSTAAIDLLIGLPGPGFIGAFAMLSWILAVKLADLSQRKAA